MSTSSTMKISDLQHILEKVKERYGDVEIRGECADCASLDMEIFVLSSDFDKTVVIQVGSFPLIKED